MLGFVAPVGDCNSPAYYRPAPTIQRQINVAEGGPLPCFGSGGTGGIEGVHFITSRLGYSPFMILIAAEPAAVQDTYAPYTDLMTEVKTGFGRTMSHLPAVFGVSRQTLYNWLKGETPKEQHQSKILQLATAARVFTEIGFIPTAQSLDRTISEGKSFLELIAQGADGQETAELLVRVEKRGATAREKLETLLGGRKPVRLEVADMGRPALNEEL